MAKSDGQFIFLSFLIDDDNFSALRYIINLCTFMRRHNLHIEYSEVNLCNNFTNLSADNQAILEDFYNRSINESLNFECTICNENSEHLNLQEARKFLSQPFLVFLENSLNDGYFIDALLKCFTSESLKIKKYKAEGWFKYSFGGGRTIQQAIEAEVKNSPKQNYKYLRCFVIHDSDKRYPNQQTYKSELNNLISFLNQNEIPFHILEKREIENYLPEDVFSTINENSDYINTINNLSPVQKDYIDIQKGLPNKELDESINWEREVKLLFSNLDNNQVEILKTKNLQMRNFKTEYPKLFLDERITKETLLARCSHQNNPNELPDLLNRITELL